MARRVLLGGFINGVDDAKPEEVRPEVVDGSASEVRIVGGGDPVGEDSARVAALGELRLLAVKELRFGDALSVGDLDFLDLGIERRLLEAHAVLAIGLQTAEEGSRLPELFQAVVI